MAESLIGLALALNVYCWALVLVRVRRIGIQLAVLTLRVTDLAESVAADREA